MTKPQLVHPAGVPFSEIKQKAAQDRLDYLAKLRDRAMRDDPLLDGYCEDAKKIKQSNDAYLASRKKSEEVELEGLTIHEQWTRLSKDQG